MPCLIHRACCRTCETSIGDEKKRMGKLLPAQSEVSPIRNMIIGSPREFLEKRFSLKFGPLAQARRAHLPKTAVEGNVLICTLMDLPMNTTVTNTALLIGA